MIPVSNLLNKNRDLSNGKQKESQLGQFWKKRGKNQRETVDEQILIIVIYFTNVETTTEKA